MRTYDELPDDVKAKMEQMARAQGIPLAEAKQQYNDAQIAMHGHERAYDNNTLMCGFKRRG